MAQPWTTPDQVIDRWLGPGKFPVTDSQLVTLIADAEDTILGEFPDVDARITAGSLRVDTVRKVVARMVIRQLRNPEGRRQTNTVSGPYTDSVTYAGDDLGEMTLSESDRKELAPRGTSNRRLFSVYPVSRTEPPVQPFGGWPGG
ncbi:Gp19/Gp15/Gp42 family protein [Paenarthrobacter sp. YJN-5]|uniref:Gp19/Gp15/Gp42 family protein n=1 Tax=Paenarthrobacter sp. YJN-5 TaxID=2735316 RepID=UPI0018779020|nr:Gp19/Gp15/Gp42 family protein [Paenarthrobacter sp. YJN-5]QOT19730.1 hypothetical protein HMI59_24015 [Paenarthrobacter sp. YJN-5]